MKYRIMRYFIWVNTVCESTCLRGSQIQRVNLKYLALCMRLCLPTLWCLFLMVPSVGLLSMIMVFHDHTHSCLAGLKFQTDFIYSKTCLKRLLKNRQNKDLKDQLLLNAGQKYCRMLPLEHSAIRLTCIKRFSILKTIFLSSLE